MSEVSEVVPPDGHDKQFCSNLHFQPALVSYLLCRSGRACGSRPHIYISELLGRGGQQLHSMRNAPHTASHIFVINSPEVRPSQGRDGEIMTLLDLPPPPNIDLVERIQIAATNRKNLIKY